MCMQYGILFCLTLTQLMLFANICLLTTLTCLVFTVIFYDEYLRRIHIDISRILCLHNIDIFTEDFFCTSLNCVVYNFNSSILL